MTDLIPEINLLDFLKLVKEGKIKDLKSCEVVFNGEHIFTAIIPHGDIFAKEYARTQAEYLALKANITGGKDPEELLSSDNQYPHLVRAREVRRLKREAVKV